MQFLNSNNKIVNSILYHLRKGSITKIDLKEVKNTKNFCQIGISRRHTIIFDDIQYLYFLSNWNFVNREFIFVLSNWNVF